MTRGAYRRFLVPGLSTLVMLAVLIGLGTWQVYRLHWKERILAQIAAAETKPPVPLTPAHALPPYSKVAATGRFRFDRAVAFGAEVRDTNGGPTLGTYQIVPLERDGDRPVLVNRGWIPQKRTAPLDEPAGTVAVAGYLRPGDRAGWFSAADDPAARQFFTLDPAAIGAAVNIPGLEPFVLVAIGAPGPYPIPAEHLPRPPN
ncbi:MAG TPA: SURF1 family protein, partial [Acetobacteraceae bacterium]